MAFNTSSSIQIFTITSLRLPVLEDNTNDLLVKIMWESESNFIMKTPKFFVTRLLSSLDRIIIYSI